MKQILSKIRITTTSTLSVVFMLAGLILMLSVPQASAACDTSDINIKTGTACAQGENTPEDIDGADGVFTTIVNVMLFIVGAIAVIMLIVGGIRYTTSNGDQGAVKAAKDTILYAIIGIIVAILAYAIVNFVVGSFTV